jgi:hypothetical protein
VLHILKLGEKSATAYCRKFSPIFCRITYQRNDDLTIRVSLEVVLGLQGFPQNTVVVDLAVDGEGKGLVIVDEGLGTGV